jgi:nickel-dependent lactate racemase
VVITSNSGYPLDQNLYQAVKGISAANEIVATGGTIICAIEARDGFPDHGPFRELLIDARSARDLTRQLEQATITIPDQWQAQILARIQDRAQVVIATDGISAADLEQAHLESTDDIGGLVRRLAAARGSELRVCVLPEGPQTIAYLDHAPSLD